MGASPSPAAGATLRGHPTALGLACAAWLTGVLLLLGTASLQTISRSTIEAEPHESLLDAFIVGARDLDADADIDGAGTPVLGRERLDVRPDAAERRFRPVPSLVLKPERILRPLLALRGPPMTRA